MSNEKAVEYCKSCALFPAVVHIEDVPMCEQCISKFPERISELESEHESLNEAIYAENLQRHEYDREIKRLRQEIDRLRSRLYFSIDHEAVKSITGCSYETASSFLKNDEILNGLRGYLIDKAEGKIKSLFADFKAKQR